MRTLENFEWGSMENFDLKQLLIKELFEDKIYSRVADVKEGDVVVDVGASVGPFIYSILDKNPSKVYAIEPSKAEFSSLTKNTKSGPVIPINKAIWEGDGLTNCLDVYYDPLNYTETMRFDTFIKLYSIDKINFLKTDCEGGEYYIFNEDNIDFLVNNVDFIVGEWHLENSKRKQMFRDFRDRYLPRFKRFEVFSVDGVDIKWDIMNENFIEYYYQVILHIDNRKS